MPDILIRWLEMPKHCIDCPCMVDKYGGDNCCLQSEEANEKINSWDDMKAGCPILELPPHGDLIDVSKIVLEYGGLAKISPHDFVGIAKYFAKQIEGQPVVVPAEREGEDAPD